MTGKHNFEGEPNSPPVILSKTGEPEIGIPVWIDNVRPEWRFRVSVRDENVEDVLTARWRVVQLDDLEPMYQSGDVTPSGGALRDFEVVVNTANLIEYRCHKLELVVSGSFLALGADPRQFDTVLLGDEDDVARASWLIWEGQGPTTPENQKAAILSSCPTIEDSTAAEPAPVVDSMR